MRRSWLLALACASIVAGPVATAAPPQKPVGVLERLVAVVGFEPILLSELRARAKPYLAEMAKAGAKGGPGAPDTNKLFRELLDEMIDEKLVALEASRSMLSVTASEVDAALQSVAAEQKLSVPELLKAAHAAGLSDDQYQDELRRQLLRQKVMALRIRPKLKGLASLTDEERQARVEAEWRKWLAAQRAATFIEVRL